MEKIIVEVRWCDRNFGAMFPDNVPGAIVVTAKTYDELLKEIPETLKFHLNVNRLLFGQLSRQNIVPLQCKH